MTSGFVGPEGDPFAEFLARFFGGQRPRQIDIGRLLSQPARELVRGAAQYAAEHGSRDLDTQHLLRAALSAEPTRSLLSRAGANPDSLASLPWAGRTSRDWEPEPLRWLGVNAVTALMTSADWSERRTGRPSRAASVFWTALGQ